jgi:uncharacterized protein
MTEIFGDTHYWIALANPRDAWHAMANAIAPRLKNARIVTTDEVLAEFLTFFGRLGAYWRQQAVVFVNAIAANPNVLVIPQTRDSFTAGLALYSQRLDKAYSLVDCISMETMRRRKIIEVVTSDHHFEQESFVILLKDVTS